MRTGFWSEDLREKKALRRHGCRWEDNIKKILRSGLSRHALICVRTGTGGGGL